jgi:hypothetical protein
MKKQNSSSLCGWETCPQSVKDNINNILAFFRAALGENLIGFYLHGSLTMDCFNPKSSDIDFLAVAAQKLTLQQKKDIISYLQKADEGSNPPEMSIVTLDSLINMVYPPVFELHYSRRTRDDYTSGKLSWEEQRVDTDLAMHYVAVRERGICLYGKPIKETFPEIPPEMFIASLVQDLHWIRQEIERLPFLYVILNPCRALAFFNENKFMSKKEGGTWALDHLPKKYAALIQTALNAYSGAESIEPPSLSLLMDFIDYAIKEFIYLASKSDAENIYFKKDF